MARSLLDTIKSNQQNVGQQQPAQPNMQQDLSSIVRAQSGQAAPAQTGPGRSSIMQRAAGQQVAAGMQGVQQQGQLQAAGLGMQQAGQEQAYQQRMADISQKVQFQADEMNRRTTEILNNIERNEKELSQKQKNVAYEQAGFLLGIQNDQYRQELTQAAQLKRLDDGLAFREEMQKAVYGSDMEIFEQALKNAEFLNADERQFKEFLKQMSLDDAYESFSQQMAANARKAMIQGLTGASQAGADYYMQNRTGKESDDLTASDDNVDSEGYYI